MFIPYRADVPLERNPIANWAIAAVTCIVSVLALNSMVSLGGYTVFSEPYSSLVLGRSILAIPGHALLHAGAVHLVGNMIFLLVFGNAICARIGNGLFVLCYVVLASAAGLFHLALDGDPAIGASGAVNGIIGMFLVFFPVNTISCFYWIFFRLGTFTISSIWLILIWFVLDLLGAFGGGSSTAYFAHIGGFLAGVGIGTILLYSGLIPMQSGERSLLSWLNLIPEPKRPTALGAAANTYGAAAGYAKPSQAAETAAKAMDRISVSCTCGKRFSVANIYAGRKMRCPSCASVLEVPSNQ